MSHGQELLQTCLYGDSAVLDRRKVRKQGKSQRAQRCGPPDLTTQFCTGRAFNRFNDALAQMADFFLVETAL